jgi:xanthine dehydrogenase molybdenum-binding subunit
MTGFRVLGKSTPRLESVPLVTGKGKFVGDMYLEGMLHAGILRSPYSHARILRMNVTKALALDGVKCIITALDNDLPANRFPNLPRQLYADDQKVLNSTVRYVGEPVAAVAAESEDVANQALALIDVEYEIMPAVFSIEEATKPGATQIHEGVTGNIAKTVRVNIGNTEKALKKADQVFEDHFETSPYLAMEPEPYGVLAYFDKQGTCTVICPTQAPFFHQSQFAAALGIKPKVVSPECAGGGFGRKTDMYDADPLIVLLAQKTRRPVRIIYDRRELLGALDTNVPLALDLQTGVKDKRFIARKLRVFARAGGYLGHAHSMLVYGICHWAALYKCSNVRADGYSVYTNNSITGTLRGFGVPMCTFAMESQIDRIANELGVDPIEFRLKNIVRKGDITPTGFRVHSCELDRCLKRVAQLTNWNQRKKNVKVGKDRRRGLGLAIAMQPTGSKILGEGDITYTEVRLLRDGHFQVSNASGDTGSGTRTVLAMIAAEELGVGINDIVMSNVDTDQPYDMGTFASRATTVSGQSMRLACIDLKRKILRAASNITGLRQKDIKIRNGKVYVRGSNRGKTFLEIANLYWERCGYDESSFLGRASYTPESQTLRWLKRRGKETIWGNWAAAHSFIAQVAEVEVDIGTGQTRLLKVTSVVDAGKIINPINAKGNVEGATYMGAGSALVESPVIDSQGRRVNDTFLDYKFLTSLDTPKIAVDFVEPRNSSATKGLGEIAISPAAASIANAIFDATGVRIREIPITSEALWKALNAA